MPHEKKDSASKVVFIDSVSSKSGLDEGFPTPDHGNVSWRTLLSRPSTPTDSFSTGIASCPPDGGELALHSHSAPEIYYAVSGQATVTAGDKVIEMKAGCLLFIPGDVPHQVVNHGSEAFSWLYCFPTDAFEHVVYEFKEKRAEPRVMSKL